MTIDRQNLIQNGLDIDEILHRKVFSNKKLLSPNEIPSIMVVGNTLPEVWEMAVVATWVNGCAIPTEYDQPIDPESRDATVMMTVTKPLEEPRIHKAIPDSFSGLAVYVEEVVNGVHNDRVREGGWSYSYHDRLNNWPGIGSWSKLDRLSNLEFELPNINQIDELITKLAKVPYSRRAQAITWVPFIDGKDLEPPCLQRVWCRLIQSDEQVLLEMNTHWRSRDAFKAAFMNMYALTTLQSNIARRLSQESGRKVDVGRYVDVSDSFHIYGSYARRGEIDKFISSINKLPFEKRTIRSDDYRVQRAFDEGLASLQ